MTISLSLIKLHENTMYNTYNIFLVLFKLIIYVLSNAYNDFNSRTSPFLFKLYIFKQSIFQETRT